MSLTLKKILEMAPFEEFDVLAGENGLSRKVTSVSFLDDSDVSAELNGGEILMTSGYILKNDLSQFVNLIRNIARANAAALFIKLKRSIDNLSQEICDIAERLNFPIILMPLTCTYSDVINQVLSILENEQVRKLKFSEEMYCLFINLILNGGDLNQLVTTLGKYINSEVAYIDTKYQHNYISSELEPFIQDISKLSITNLTSKYRNQSVKIDRKHYGYIVYFNNYHDNSGDEYNDIAINHASTAIKLKIQIKISNLEIENQHKNEFVQDILLNNIKSQMVIESRAKHYGWSYENGLCAVVVKIDNFKKRNNEFSHKKKEEASLETVREIIFNTCKTIMEENFKSVLSTILNDSITFLIESPTLEPNDFHCMLLGAGDKMRKYIQAKLGFTLTIGIGEYRQSIKDAHLSYKEAQNAVKLGKTLYKQNRTVFYNDLRVYRLLDPIYNTREAEEFCNASIGLLMKHDEKHGTELYKTLICINECNWNLKNAAAMMYIHYNTIKYRYRKIEEILNADLEDIEERFIISMSIKLMRMAD
jgi:purine catabolism regulator